MMVSIFSCVSLPSVLLLYWGSLLKYFVHVFSFLVGYLFSYDWTVRVLCVLENCPVLDIYFLYVLHPSLRLSLSFSKQWHLTTNFFFNFGEVKFTNFISCIVCVVDILFWKTLPKSSTLGWSQFPMFPSRNLRISTHI